MQLNIGSVYNNLMYYNDYENIHLFNIPIDAITMKDTINLVV